eukprot:symbB.v1.2.029555.t1/scaffold3245.1/size65031/1
MSMRQKKSGKINQYSYGHSQVVKRSDKKMYETTVKARTALCVKIVFESKQTRFCCHMKLRAFEEAFSSGMRTKQLESLVDDKDAFELYVSKAQREWKKRGEVGPAFESLEQLVAIANLQTSSMWTCRFCQVKHTCAQAHCESCNRHWKQADAASGPRSQSRRSRRQQKGNGERKKADQSSNQVATKDGKAAEQEDAIFSNNLPWVASSPHGRPQVMDVKPSTEEASAAMPIPPESKPTGSSSDSAPLGEEDIAKLHQHLKALKQTLGSLPAELEQKLAMCEEKAREKALSHGHPNRLGKLTKQMKNLASKIQSMDEGWQGFAQKVAAKFEEHRKLYHSSRESLVQEYLVKSQELQIAKQEVQLASQHLFAEQVVPPTPSATEETAMLMEQAIQEDAQLGRKPSSKDQGGGQERSAYPDQMSIEHDVRCGEDPDVFELLDQGPDFASACSPFVGVCEDEICCTDAFDGVWDEDMVQPRPESFLSNSSVPLLRAENVAQLGPCAQQRLCLWPLTDDPPCPSDRWCGDSDEESIAALFRACVSPSFSRDLKPKSVSFDTTVDVFGFDPDSSADALPEEWWTVVDEPTALLVDDSPQRSSQSCQDQDESENDPYQGFWKDWHSSWEGSDDDLGVSFFRWIDVLSLTDMHPYRQGGSIPFITFGLRGHHLGRRDFSSPDLLPGRIKELVWNLWQDEVRRFEQVLIHFIRPQPTRELGAEGVIILLIEILCDEIPPASSPALAVTCDTGHRLMDSPKALYVDRAVDARLLLPHFGLSYLCAPRGFRQCVFTVASAAIGAYFVPVPEGALVKLVIGAKLRIFAQAFEWFPDLERFAAVVREQVRRGVQEHGLVLHRHGTTPEQPLDHTFLVVTGDDELRQDARRSKSGERGVKFVMLQGFLMLTCLSTRGGMLACAISFLSALLRGALVLNCHGLKCFVFLAVVLGKRLLRPCAVTLVALWPRSAVYGLRELNGQMKICGNSRTGIMLRLSHWSKWLQSVRRHAEAIDLDVSDVSSAGTSGAAPCPGDRWCAAPPSTASSRGSRRSWTRGGQNGGPDYTEDNLDLCSDRHHHSGSSLVVPISLDAVLPPPSVENAIPVKIPFVQDCNLAKSIANIEWQVMPSLPEGMQVHRSTAIEFLRADPGCGVPNAVPLRHELYIDGSATLEHCAWSMIHVHRFADGKRKFVGLLAGNVALSPEDPQWIGAQHLDNISAELTAMVVAHAFAVSLPQPCCICPDLRFGAYDLDWAWICSSGSHIKQMLPAVDEDAIIAQGDDGESIRLGACEVVVHIADPRRLVLVVSHGSFEFVVVSLHAPCLSTLSSLDDVAAWWQETTRLLQPLPIDRCIVFVDANASLGVDALPLVGSHGAEPESAQSLLFHEARAHVDHLPSVLCLQGCLQGSAGPAKMAWDDHKLRDPTRCAQFREALATLPIPHWTISADDHCKLWEMQFLQLAEHFFAKSPDDPKPRRRPALTAPTLALIQFKRHVLSLARSADGLAYEDYKAILRDVEKQVRGMVAKDQRAWYDDLICQVQKSGELHDSAHMFRLLRRLGSRKYKSPRRPLPMLLKPDGTHTTTVHEMQEVFRSQFAEIEGGVLTTLEALAEDHHRHELLPAESIDLSLLIGYCAGDFQDETWKGYGTDMAHHYAHAFLSWARSSGTPSSLMFLDLAAAFYSVLRQGLFRNEICDQHLCYAFKSLGISPDELREVIATVTSEAADEGVSDHCDLVLKGLFEATYFVMDGVEGVTHTSKGTRPGDPIADLLFNMAMSLIQRSVRHVPPHGYTAVAYVDDVVIMAHAPTNEALRHMTQLVVSTFFDEAKHRGLCMNFDARKTEAIFQPAGAGTRAFRDHWFREQHGRLPILTEASLHHLNLVHKYRHLGTQIQHGADIAADSREKAALARQAWGPLSRSFFCKRNVGLGAKTPVFKSLVNCHVWSWWRDAPAKAWSNTVHVNRLLYVKRLICSGPSFLWAYLWNNHSDRAWLNQLHASCRWLATHCPAQLPLQVEASIEDWIAFIAMDATWRGRVKKTAKAALSHFRLAAEGKVWQLGALHRLAAVECYDAPLSSTENVQWQCEQCDKQFKSRRALAMHASKVHGYVRRSKYFIDSDVCHACLRKYHTLARALVHLDHNPGCTAQLDACFGPMADDTVEALSDQLREHTAAYKVAGWQSTKAFCPVVRVLGPHLPPIGSQEAMEMRAKWDARREAGCRFQSLQGFAIGPVQEASGPVDSVAAPEVSFVMNTYGGAVVGQLACAQDYGLSFLCAQINVRSLFFVHFFSGYRRRGDLQHWLEDEIVGEGYRIYCVSVDICLCKDNFDLTDDQSLSFWIGKAKQGYVIGGGGGPPCETMSAARYSGPPDRVNIGSRLLRFLLSFLLEMAIMGLCGFLEHPAFPVWLRGQDPPSVWAVPLVKALSKLGCVRISTIDQCSFGCVAMKPTTFLLVRLPGLQRMLTRPGLRGRCIHPKGFHLALAGTDAKGRFHTAKAKVYPPALNQTLSAGVKEFAELCWANRITAPENPEDLDSLRSFEFVSEDVVQPDFHA